MKKIRSSFVLCVVAAILSLVIGIVMLPPLNIGQNMLSALLALVLGACMIAFILPEIMSTRGVICILNFVEFVLIAIVALVLVVEEVLPFMDYGTCRLFAVAIWIHGVVGVFKIYNTRIASSKKGLALPLFTNILFITAGSYLFASPLLSEAFMSWVFALFFFLLAFLMTVLSLLYAPQKSKTRAKSK